MKETGAGICYAELQTKACDLDHDFASKSKTRQYQLIRTLCHQNQLFSRMKTKVVQETTQPTSNKAQEWLLEIRPMLSVANVQKKYVINMDQMSLRFSLLSNKTSNSGGESTIANRSNANRKAYCAVSLAVCADGTKLKPLLIFKGATHGRLATKELAQSQYRNKLVLAAQPVACLDEMAMFDWVNSVLVPHLQEKAAGTPVFLFVDQFAAHNTPAMHARMKCLGIQLYHIPGDCTWLVQPVDLGIKNSFRERIKEKWWDWTNRPEADAITPPPSRKDIQQWVTETWDSMPESIIRTSWLKNDYSWIASS